MNEYDCIALLGFYMAIVAVAYIKYLNNKIDNKIDNKEEKE